MKSCDEMVNSLLERRKQYLERRKKMRTICTIVSVCCACFVVCIWQKEKSGLVTLDDSIIIGEKDYISPDELDVPYKDAHNEQVQDVEEKLVTQSSSYNNGSFNGVCDEPGDISGVVVVDGSTYVQFTDDSKTYTPDVYLGLAKEFEGTYKTYLADDSCRLYTTKENADVLIVDPGNGGVVTLVRQKEMISSYPCSHSASYSLPEKGNFGMTMSLREAVDKYGDTVIYRVVIQIFDDEEQIKDKDFFMAEADRLASFRYITAIEEYINERGSGIEFTIHATANQILDFPAGSDYKYFLLLYDEAMI